MRALKDRLSKNCQFQQSITDYISQIKEYPNVVIWGCSEAKNKVITLLEEYGAAGNVKFYADNNSSLWGTVIDGRMVLSPDEVIEKINTGDIDKIIIASLFLESIRNQLISMGVGENYFCLNGYPLSMDYFKYAKTSPFEIIMGEITAYERAYSLMEDTKSKELYASILNSKICMNYLSLSCLVTESKWQYFDPELISLNNEEIFVDAGAFRGDTLRRFVELTNGEFRKYIALEADSVNYVALLNEIKKMPTISARIKPYPVACWDEVTTLSFQTLGKGGSKVVENGECKVEANTLDNLLRNERVTFIKMDIEGAELKALVGAKKSILNQNPILAICVYHDLVHMHQVPNYISEINPNYTFYLRKYMEHTDLETVLYAIPKK